MCSLLFFLVLVWALVVAGCSRQPESLMLSGATMGTRWHVTVIPVEGQVPNSALQNGIQQRLDEINQSMSTYLDDSELNRINRGPLNQWLPLSPELARVIDESERIGRDTGGALDITLGPLVNLWGFGPDNEPVTIPSEAEIDAARSRTGLDKFEIRDGRIRKLADIYIDLSSVAKGFAVDQVGRYLAAEGFSHYLVEIGGELVARGHKANGRPWRIGIEKPSPGRSGVQAAIALSKTAISDTAMATSGDYRNYIERDGQRFAHIIDPRTGKPVTNRLASVTVIADNTLTADGLATGLTVMGVDAALAFAEQHNLAIYVIMKTDAGFDTVHSSAFTAYLN